MPRPKTKTELLAAATNQFDKMWIIIDGMTPKEQALLFCFPIMDKDKEAHWKRDKNLRDVLVHLYEWHQLLLNWMKNNQKYDEVIPFLPRPYTWKSYGDMNVGFWEKHQQTSLEDSKALILQSHKNVIAMIEELTDEELFTKSYFKWSGTTNVGSYCISATSSHYDWAIKKLKRQVKALNNQAD